MTIELEVWRTGPGVGTEATVLKVPSSRLLEDGQDTDKVHNYIFESFLATFEQKLNLSDPAHPTDMMFGQLGFLDNMGIFEAVGDQDSFGVALINLYLNRGITNVLTFIFQPEIEEKRQKRLKTKGTHGGEFFAPTDEKPKRRRSFPAHAPNRFHDSALRPERINPFLTAESKSGFAVSERPYTGRSAHSLPLASSQWHLFGSHQGLFSSFRGDSEPTSALSPPSPRSTTSGRLSRAGSIKAAVKKVVQKPVKKVPETKDEERERFKFLYQEEKRVTFARGGDDAEAEMIPYKLEAVDEIDEGETDHQSNEDVDDDEEISNEDRIVTKYVYHTKKFHYEHS